MQLKVGLDCDGVIADFNKGYLQRFGKWPQKDWAITRNVEHILINEKDFWLNLPVIELPNFTPTMFCSARVNNRNWTKLYLKSLGINSKLYQVNGYHLSKVKTIGHKVDVFIEDSIKNFIDLNLNGIPCLLINREHNQEWGPIGRVYSLDKEEIEDTYYLFKETMFPYFNELINN